jgi:hypothetical protein
MVPQPVFSCLAMVLPLSNKRTSARNIFTLLVRLSLLHGKLATITGTAPPYWIGLAVASNDRPWLLSLIFDYSVQTLPIHNDKYYYN